VSVPPAPNRDSSASPFRPITPPKAISIVDYTDLSGDTVVARFHLAGAGAGAQADPASEETLLRVDQPFANHNGGQLAFGPDGLLYIGLGDGGSGGDPQGYGQALTTLLGKILRLNVEDDPGGAPYLVPPDNPWVGESGRRSEIWAYGLRNPWRFSFDRLTGDLYIADVGQDRYEEIDFQPAASAGGENYGWNLMEGTRCYPETAQDCDRTGLTLPVAVYDHDTGGCAVTGGFVYRGTVFPALRGIYIYGDFCTGRIWGLSRSKAQWSSALLLETGFAIAAFGEDEDGELYAADYATGNLYRITLS
jgi:glucose/arabinose dehydrogenase